MEKQRLIFNFIVKNMGIKPLINSLYKKSSERALQRDNKKLKKKFDELFEIFFDDNPDLKEIIHDTRIPILKEKIKKSLYLNLLDIVIDDDEFNPQELYKFEANIDFLLFINDEMEYLCKYYKDKYNILLPDESILFSNDIKIKELFQWIIKESPFKKIDYLSESSFYEKEIDSKNISDWKKGKHVIRVKTILKIKKNLNIIASQENINNAKEYIDFFIQFLYLETWRLRITKDCPFAQEYFLQFIGNFMVFLNGNQERLNQELLDLGEIINLHSESFYEFGLSISKLVDEENDENKISPDILKYPEYKLTENSDQEIMFKLKGLFTDEEVVNSKIKPLFLQLDPLILDLKKFAKNSYIRQEYLTLIKNG